MFKKTIIIIAIILVSGFSGIIFNRYLFPRLAETKIFSKYDFLKKPSSEVTVINKTEQILVKEESSVTKIANSIAPSVVNVVSISNKENKSGTYKSTLTDSYKNGTGVIITSDGIIMTYLDAIISEGARYKIMTYDGNVYDGEIWGIDQWSNLVFLKINASNLPVVSFKDSNELKPGEKIVAIGNGGEKHQNQFFSGLLSNFNSDFSLSGKTLAISDKIQGVFETDMPQASSCIGGPVIDYSGQTIGLMGEIDKDNKSTYFIIPANRVRLVIDRAIKKELDKNVSLGIYYLPVTKTLALANDLKVNKGSLVYSPSGQQGLAILSGSPAEKAGIQINDILTAVGGEEITNDQNLPDLLYKYKKGDEVEFTVLRDGQEVKLTVKF